MCDFIDTNNERLTNARDDAAHRVMQHCRNGHCEMAKKVLVSFDDIEPHLHGACGCKRAPLVPGPIRSFVLKITGK